MQNLLKKYNITKEEFEKGVDVIAKNIGKIPEIMVTMAIADLLANGDIKEKENE